MSAPTPANLRLDGHCLIVLERTLLVAAPQEGCALLLGQHRNDTLELEAIWPCLNTWQPAGERGSRFSLDPREQLLAQRWCRQRRQRVLGAAHSHPSSEAVPSLTDRQLCVSPTLVLIRSGLATGLDALRAWWMLESDPAQGLPEPLELPIELRGATPGAGHLGE